MPTDLSAYRATGTNNPNKQVSVTRWNNLLTELESLGQVTQRVITPFDFGAVGATVENLGASTDDTLALQDFFDFAFAVDQAGLTFDFSGHWAISADMFAGRPLYYSDVPNNKSYHGRKFICGSMYVLSGASIDTVLTISGPYSTWEGHLFIHDGSEGVQPYASRRFNYGVRVMQATQGSLEKLTVHSAKKDAIWIDTLAVSWTMRPGSPYQIGSVSKNSIGFTVGRCFGLNCGSTTVFGLTDGHCNSYTVSAKDQGGDPAQAGTFNTTEASFTSSGEQRTKLTVPSTSELLEGEFGMMRTELSPSDYTSIAADNSTAKFTFTSGTPASLGLAVGLSFTLEDNSNVGSNDGTSFEIVTVGSDYVTVWPKPTTEAAKVYTHLYTEFSLHRIMTVLNSTTFSVYPWVPDSHNSKFYHVSGSAAKVTGNDAACVGFGYLGANNCGIGLNVQTLYCPTVENFLADIGNIGIAQGINSGTACLGLSVKHSHSEGVTWDVAQITTSDITSMELHANSSFGGSIVGLQPRAATASARQISYETGWSAGNSISFHRSEASYGAPDNTTSFGNTTISNLPTNASRILIGDGNDQICTISFNEAAARVGRKSANIAWVSYDGFTPLGTLTFALDSTMTGLGWALSGDTTVSPVGHNSAGVVVFDTIRKRATVLMA